MKLFSALLFMTLILSFAVKANSDEQDLIEEGYYKEDYNDQESYYSPRDELMLEILTIDYNIPEGMNLSGRNKLSEEQLSKLSHRQRQIYHTNVSRVKKSMSREDAIRESKGLSNNINDYSSYRQFIGAGKLDTSGHTELTDRQLELLDQTHRFAVKQYRYARVSYLRSI